MLVSLCKSSWTFCPGFKALYFDPPLSWPNTLIKPEKEAKIFPPLKCLTVIFKWFYLM